MAKVLLEDILKLFAERKTPLYRRDIVALLDESDIPVQEALRVAVADGTILRIRQGLYCLPDMDPADVSKRVAPYKAYYAEGRKRIRVM